MNTSAKEGVLFLQSSMQLRKIPGNAIIIVVCANHGVLENEKNKKAD